MQEVSDFIDFVTHKHQAKTINTQQHEMLKAWSSWFEAGNHLDAASPDAASDYQQLLLNKYQ